MARARAGECSASATAELRFVYGLSAHDIFPLGPLGVTHAHCDGATQAEPVAHAAREVQFILLKLHARTAAVTKFAACQISTDVVQRNRNARRQTFDYGNKFWAVGFPGSEPTQHVLYLSIAKGRRLAHVFLAQRGGAHSRKYLGLIGQGRKWVAVHKDAHLNERLVQQHPNP